MRFFGEKWLCLRKCVEFLQIHSGHTDHSKKLFVNKTTCLHYLRHKYSKNAYGFGGIALELSKELTSFEFCIIEAVTEVEVICLEATMWMITTATKSVPKSILICVPNLLRGNGGNQTGNILFWKKKIFRLINFTFLENILGTIHIKIHTINL